MSSRRDLLCSFAALAVAPAVAGPAMALARHPSRSPSLDDVLLGLLPRLDSAAAAGRRVWQRRLLGREEAELFARDLLSAAGRGAGAAAAYVHTARRLDFAAGRTVVVDGWVVARTEALLCALAATGAAT